MGDLTWSFLIEGSVSTRSFLSSASCYLEIYSRSTSTAGGGYTSSLIVRAGAGGGGMVERDITRFTKESPRSFEAYAGSLAGSGGFFY
jgi:hypothetical protein